jgi:hypothetical protein
MQHRYWSNFERHQHTIIMQWHILMFISAHSLMLLGHGIMGFEHRTAMCHTAAGKVGGAVSYGNRSRSLMQKARS